MQICRYCKKAKKPLKTLYKKLLKFVQLKVPNVTEKDLFCDKCFLSLEKRLEAFLEFRRAQLQVPVSSTTSISTEGISSPEPPSKFSYSQIIGSESQDLKSFQSFSLTSSSSPSNSEPIKVITQAIVSSRKSNSPKTAIRIKNADIVKQIQGLAEQFKSAKSRTELPEQVESIISSTTSIPPTPVPPLRTVGASSNNAAPIISNEGIFEQPILGEESILPPGKEVVEYDDSDEDIFDPGIPFPNIQPLIKRRKIIRSNKDLDWSYKTGG